MDLRGSPAPRAQHRPGSARRPLSSRQGRNPITGEEWEAPPNTTNNSSITKDCPRPNSRPDNVPSLNLKYLRDTDEPTGAINISLRDYKLDTPNSASTVSWGTSRSDRRHNNSSQTVLATQKTDHVPSLPLAAKPPSARKIPKQPSAWDRAPVPDDVPAPSARHQQLYQQYAQETRQAFRAHAHPNNVSEEELDNAVQALRQTSARNMAADGSWSQRPMVEEDVVEEAWKRQRYTANQLRKKLDAEELLEQNKKFKLMETVMVDQLSRAVISAPEQDHRGNSEGGSTTRRARGTNRHLHDSKVSTRTTATENLLSRRLRFGARILTRNGRDAVRELTGFFFQLDGSLTVYEFKQFGKSAKAIPFIQRGQFLHQDGPRSGLPFSISDIYTGADLLIPTRGQQALSAELAQHEFLTLRVTDIDQSEKEELGCEEDDVDSARLEDAKRAHEENQQFLLEVQEAARGQIARRGVKTVTGLGRHYRALDRSGRGVLLQHDLERGLLHFHIDLPPQVLEQVFDIVDPEGERRVDHSVFTRAVLGEMTESRKALVRKAFAKVDTHRKGAVNLSDINKFFNANSPYKPGSDADCTKSALQVFLDSVRASPSQEVVTFAEFEEYYEGLSVGIAGDADFANVLRNTWNI